PAVRAGPSGAGAAHRGRGPSVDERHGSVRGGGHRLAKPGRMAGGEDRQPRCTIQVPLVERLDYERSRRVPQGKPLLKFVRVLGRELVTPGMADDTHDGTAP